MIFAKRKDVTDKGAIRGGHNLDTGMTCGFSTPSVSGVPAGLDPAGLANNGGPTQTIAVLSGSRAINAGDQAGCAASPVDNRDQRGAVRPGGGYPNCTIGAFEFGRAPPPQVSRYSPRSVCSLGLAIGLGAGGWFLLRTRPGAASRARTRPR